MPLAKVPSVAVKAVKKLFPKATLDKTVNKTVDDGVVTFEVPLQNGKLSYEVTVTEDGTVTEIAKDMPFKNLPKAVIAGVNKHFPKSKVQESAELTVPGETEKKYYVELTNAEGKKVLLTLDASGEVLEEE